MIKIGIDFDDVLAGFVNIACELCNKERGTAYTKEDVVLHTQKKTSLHGDMTHVLQQRMYRRITMMTEHMRCSRYRLTQKCLCVCSDRKLTCIL